MVLVPVAVTKSGQQEDPSSLFETFGSRTMCSSKNITKSLRQYALVQPGVTPQCVGFGWTLYLRVQPFGMFEHSYLGGQCSPLQSFFLAKSLIYGILATADK